MKPTKEVKKVGLVEKIFNCLGYYKQVVKKTRKPRAIKTPKNIPAPGANVQRSEAWV